MLMEVFPKTMPSSDPAILSFMFVGRRRLQDLVCELLLREDVSESLVPMLAACLRVIESSHEARMQLLLEVISDIQLPLNEQTLGELLVIIHTI